MPGGASSFLPRCAWRVAGRARAGRSDEQLLPVGQREIAAAGPVRSITRAEALDDDRRARGERILVPAAPEQRVGRAPLNHPADDLAVRALDVDVKPRVRIGPFHLGDGALER